MAFIKVANSSRERRLSSRQGEQYYSSLALYYKLSKNLQEDAKILADVRQTGAGIIVKTIALSGPYRPYHLKINIVIVIQLFFAKKGDFPLIECQFRN